MYVCVRAVYILLLLSWVYICRCRRLNIIEWQAPHRSGSWHTSCMLVCKGMGVVELHAGELCALIVTQRTLCTLWPTQSHCSGFVKCRIVSIDYARQWDHTRIIYPQKWLTDGDVVTRQHCWCHTLIFIAHTDHTLAKWLGDWVSMHRLFNL